MQMHQAPGAERWSTDSVPAKHRFDYYFDAVSKAVTPFVVHNVAPHDFLAEIVATDVNGISVMRHSGSGHRASRGTREIALSGEHSFHLLLDHASPWMLSHRGEARLRPRDLVLYDSRHAMHLECAPSYDMVHLKFTEQFMRQWVPHPGALVGRRISFDSGWGAALSSFAAQLSPTFVLQSPLPLSMIADHLGSLLALTAHDMGLAIEAPARQSQALCDRICERIAARCTDPSLSASAVAQSLGISVRTLHRGLLSCHRTFGAAVMAARVDIALRMLKAPNFARITSAEIGRRAGFSDASHFVRVFRRHTGLTPRRVRGNGSSSSA
jgi:AraC-like DNA-binding protein